MRAVYLKELRSYFNTLSAYMFIALVLLFGGAAFATVNLAQETASMNAVMESLHYVLFLATPILTARLASGTDRTLFSAPVRAGAIVAGKYFAALSVLAVALAASLIYPLILVFIGDPSWSETASGFLGLLLLGGTLLSAGTLVSSLISKRAAAGALTLCAMLLVLLAQAVLPGMSPPLKAVLTLAAPSYHLSAFFSGVAGLSDIAYFITLSALLVFFSARAITYRMRFR